MSDQEKLPESTLNQTNATPPDSSQTDSKIDGVNKESATAVNFLILDQFPDLSKVDFEKDDFFKRILSENKDQLETVQKENVFLLADAIAKRYMLQGIVCLFPQIHRETAQAVIETVNFGEVSDKDRPNFIELAKMHQKVSRAMIDYMLEKNNGAGFNPLEIAEIKAGIKMADATDEIYSKWEFMQHDIGSPTTRQQMGFTSKWHIVRKSDSQFGAMDYHEVSYQDIYSREYTQIVKALEDLLKEMESIGGCVEYYDIDPEVLNAKFDYYRQLLRAYKETNPKKLPQIWLEVDKAFVHQGGNLRAVHPLEDGYGANTTGMIPEQSLRYFIPNPANDLVAQKKNFILEKFPALLKGNEEATKQLDYIKNVDAGIALYVVRSGMELVFKIAGHNIPNEEEARAEGVHVYIDPNTMKERLKEAKELFKGFFAPEYHGLLDKISDDAALAEVAVHEFGHNIGDYKFGKGIENAPGIEEWKATATTYVSQTLDPDTWTDEALESNFLSFLCQAMRYSQRRNEKSQKPYYNSDRFFMKLAVENGLLVKQGDKWGINLARENLLAYANAVKDKWLELQKIYAAKDRNELEKFIKEAVTASPFMDDADKFTKPE